MHLHIYISISASLTPKELTAFITRSAWHSGWIGNGSPLLSDSIFVLFKSLCPGLPAAWHTACRRRVMHGGTRGTWAQSCCKAEALRAHWEGKLPRTMPSFDEVLKEAGEFGRFQKRVFFLLCQTGITFSFLFASVVFLGQVPDNYWCRIPGAADLSEKCGWTLEEERNFTVLPLLLLVNGSSGGRCERLDVTWDAAAGCASPLSHRLDGRVGSPPLATCQDSWVYQQPHASIVSEVRKGSVPTSALPSQGGIAVGGPKDESLLQALIFLTGLALVPPTDQDKEWDQVSVSNFQGKVSWAGWCLLLLLSFTGGIWC